MRMSGHVAHQIGALHATEARSALHMHAANLLRGCNARSAAVPLPQLPRSQDGRSVSRAWPSFAACRDPALAARHAFCSHGCQQRHLQTLQPAAAAASAAASAAGVQQRASAAGDPAALQQGGLVVVESPAKARKIQQYLGSGFTVRLQAMIHEVTS